MVQQQILVAAKQFSLIASLVIALGPMASVARCCCFGEQVRQWIGSTSQFDRCYAPSLAGISIAAEPVDPKPAERNCCQTLAARIPVTDLLSRASACESSVDTRACLCERACHACEAPVFHARLNSEDFSRAGAQFAVVIGSIAPRLSNVVSRNEATSVISFLSAQDRCVLLCRWLN